MNLVEETCVVIVDFKSERKCGAPVFFASMCFKHYESQSLLNAKREKQTETLGQMLANAGGRQKLAQSLGPSLRRRRDYAVV